MRAFSRWAGGLAMAGMLATAATPAMAQRGWGGGYGGGYGGGSYGGGYGGRYDRGYRRGGGGGDGLGIFLGVAALVGAVAVIASSHEKDKRAAENRAYDPNYQTPNYQTPNPQAPAYQGNDPHYQGAAPSAAENSAVDACALAAREEGAQGGASAEVRDITSTRPFNGGWAVDGTVDQRDGYSGQGGGVQRRFSCTWKDGRVSDMILSRDTVALR